MQVRISKLSPAAVAVAIAVSTLPAKAQVQDQRLPEVQVRSGAESGPVAREAATGPLGERPLVDTPFSITPFTREFIDRRQANTLVDVARSDPSVTVITPAGAFAGQINIRGFIVFPDNYLYDGLVVGPSFSGATYPLDGFERVEILKGPSAFLYGLSGFGSVGGVVNFVPKRPRNDRIARFSAGYMSDEVGRAAVDLGERFGGDRSVGLRLNASYEGGETNVGQMGLDNKVLALAADWRIAPGLNVAVGYDYVTVDMSRYQNGFLIAPGVPVPDAPDPRRNLMQPWTWFRQTLEQGYVRADWAFADDWSFTAQFLKGDSPRPYLSPGPVQLLSGTGDTRLNVIAVVDGKYRHETGSATLRGKFVTGPFRHEVSLGGAYNWYDYSSGLANVAVLPSNLYNPIYYPDPGFPQGVPVGRLIENTARSLFASDIIQLTDRWSVLVGARRVFLDWQNFNGLTGATTLDQSQAKTSPTYALMFKPTPASLVYANYAEGLERGGIAPAGTLNANQQMPPIDTRQIELGGKLDLARGLSLSTAVFEIEKGLEYTDAATRTYVQDGRQVHRGWEVFLSGAVTPDFTLVGGFTLLDPEARRTGNAATEGKSPIGVPERTISLWGDYRLPWASGLFFNAGVFHASDQYVDATNTRSIPSWTRVDVGLRYETRVSGKSTRFLIGVDNVFDREYWQGVNAGTLAVGAPRTLRATVRIDL